MKGAPFSQSTVRPIASFPTGAFPHGLAGPALAQLRMRRLNRLGLAASKVDSIGVSINELISAGREVRELQTWVQRRDKDLAIVTDLPAGRARTP